MKWLNKNLHVLVILLVLLLLMVVLYPVKGTASPMTFCWEPGTGEVNDYLVEVTDAFGQIVIRATTVEPCYSFDYEGGLLLSVTAINSTGEPSIPSEWSDMELSTSYRNMIKATAANLEIPQLIFLSAWVNEALGTWEDPHETD